MTTLLAPLAFSIALQSAAYPVVSVPSGVPVMVVAGSGFVAPDVASGNKHDRLIESLRKRQWIIKSVANRFFAFDPTLWNTWGSGSDIIALNFARIAAGTEVPLTDEVWAGIRSLGVDPATLPDLAKRGSARFSVHLSVGIALKSGESTLETVLIAQPSATDQKSAAPADRSSTTTQTPRSSDEIVFWTSRPTDAQWKRESIAAAMEILAVREREQKDILDALRVSMFKEQQKVLESAFGTLGDAHSVASLSDSFREMLASGYSLREHTSRESLLNGSFRVEKVSLVVSVFADDSRAFGKGFWLKEFRPIKP